MVVQQVDLIDIEDAVVGLGQKPGQDGPYAVPGCLFEVDAAGHPVLGGVQRQGNDPDPALDNRPLPVTEPAALAAAFCLIRGQRELTAFDGLDGGKKGCQGAHRGRFGGPFFSAYQDSADTGIDGV